MAKLLYGDLLLKGNKSLQLEDGDTNTMSLKAAAAMGSNLTLTLPSAITANGALISDGSGNLSIALVVNANVDASAAIAESKLTLDQNTADLATHALDNLTVASLASQSLLVGSSSSAVASLAAGTNGQVLKIVAGNVAWAADSGVSAFTATWVNADTVTKAITHSLGTTDVLVEIYDIDSGDTIGVESVVRTDANTLTVTASEAPDVGGSGWKVLIVKAG